MPYDYQTERPKLHTEEGIEKLIHGRDRLFVLAKRQGGFISETDARGCFEFSINWENQACLDRLIELGDLVLVGNGGGEQTYRLPRNLL